MVSLVTQTAAGVDLHVRPGGGFFADDHTLENWKAAEWRPRVIDRQRYGNWQKRGSRDMAARANDWARRILDEHQVPPLAAAAQVEVLRRHFVGQIFTPTADNWPATAAAVVIGGGIVGVAIAFWLSRTGLDTVLLEMRSDLGTLTSDQSIESFRAQFTEPTMSADIADRVIARQHDHSTVVDRARDLVPPGVSKQLPIPS